MLSNWLASPTGQADLWVIAVAATTNAACALVGVFLVLRRMSLLGDALSHAVLPGLVVAFVLSGQVSLAPMVAGALVVGLLTSGLTELLHRQGGVSEDASLGVVYTSLFALGVVLIKRYASQVHLDADCLLFGLVEFAPIYTVNLAGWEVPRALVSIGPVLAINAAVIALCWKELKLTSFDAALATALGFRAAAVHYLLMALVTMTAVASFEAVGSILVVAMLIVPAATAHLLTDRLAPLVGLSVLLGVLSAVVGYAASVWWDTNTAGMMATVAGGMYLLTAAFAPRYGVLGRVVARARTALRIHREDILAMLFRLEEIAGSRKLAPREAVQAMGGGWMARWSLWSLLRSGQVATAEQRLTLTASGRTRATQLVRSHRLWETYLVERLGLSREQVHSPAERMEHYIGRGLQQQIAAELRDAQEDPHGRGIPGEAGT